MRDYPKLKRHETGCPLCGQESAEYGARGWKVHEIPYAVRARVRRCRASGRTAAGVDRLLRSFASADNFADVGSRNAFGSSIELGDNDGSMIYLTSQLEVRNGIVAEVVVKLANEDVPRLLAELTRIAQQRGLIEIGLQ